MASILGFLNEYGGLIAICAVFTSIIGAYGTMARIKIAKQQTRRESDEG